MLKLIAASTLLASSLAVTDASVSTSAPISETPTITSNPKPNPKATKPGRISFHFSDNIGTTNYDVSSELRKLDGDYRVGLTVRADKGQAQTIEDGASKWSITSHDNGFLVNLTAKQASTSPVAKLFEAQIARCATLLTTPPQQRDAYKKRVPEWTLTLSLSPTRFAQAVTAVRAAHKDGKTLALALEAEDIEGIECGSFVLFGEG